MSGNAVKHLWCCWTQVFVPSHRADLECVFIIGAQAIIAGKGSYDPGRNLNGIF